MGLFDFLGNNAGGIIGGLLGAASSSGGKANETTMAKGPWDPAQPYILKNLQNADELQRYYQKNPFNAQQMAAYDNIFADADHFRDSVAPGLMGFANRGMTSSYDRQRGGAPGSGAGYGGDYQAGGLRSSSGDSAQGPFSVAPFVSAAAAQQAGPMPDGGNIPTQRQQGARFGAVNWAKANPYNGAIAAPTTVADDRAAAAKNAGLLNLDGMSAGLMGAAGAKGLLNTSGHIAREPSDWDKMGDFEKANFYHDNPTIAKVTQLLQAGFSLTDIAKMQEELDPGFAARQAAIAAGDLFGGGITGYRGVDFGNTFDGMGQGDIDSMGVDLGGLSDYAPGGSRSDGSDGYSRGYGGGGVW